MIITYVINLDRDTEKLRKVRGVFPWKLTRVPAVDGAKAPGRPRFASKLAYGCLLSHRRVWRMVAESGSPALVVEDDCQPSDDKNFEASFARLLQTLPLDFDVALFGYTASDVAGDHLITAAVAPIMKRRATRQVNADWCVPGVFTGTHCYLVSPQGAKKLLKDTTIFHADAVMCRNANLVLYCTRKPIATQHVKGRVRYNRHLTWEWILSEPLATSGPMSIRVGHIVLLYIIAVFVLALSKNPILRLSSRALVVLPTVHYLNTRTHVLHNMRHTDAATPPTGTNNKTIEVLRHLNDAVSTLTFIVLFSVAASRGVFVPVVDLVLAAQLARAVIILGAPMRDPSGVCEEKAVKRYSLFEYCGSLRVSGHIMGAVFLSYLVPKIGLPLVVLQAALILSSRSHYPGDVALGIIVASALLWIFQKEKYLHTTPSV